MSSIHNLSRPKLAHKTRLRFDRHEGRFVLLYPEHGLILNESASEVLQLCTGHLTVPMIIDLLVQRHSEYHRESIRAGVVALLSDLWIRRLVQG
jgi:pyrroloquinoline quinone biosynthesis protein D